MNKISVNEKETEMTISKSKQENFELWSKRLYPTESVKNLVLEQMQVTITCQLSFR